MPIVAPNWSHISVHIEHLWLWVPAFAGTTDGVSAYTSPASKRGIPAIDHKTIRRMIRRRLAHDVDRDAAEIGGLAETAHRDARHHVGDEFLVTHDAGGHVALDPAGQDRIRSDAVARQFDRERAAKRVQRRFRAGVVLVAR